jgi:hypothetical protein
MKRIFISLYVLFLNSCLPGQLTDKAFYNINESSVRLIINTGRDSSVKTNYEQTHNLPGSSCKLLTVTNSFDTLARLGISIRLWANIIKPEKSTFYGDYPSLGLLEKIQSLKITLENQDKSIEITNFLKGDSTISNFIWGKYLLEYSHYSNRNCFVLPYFQNTEDLLKTLNKEADKLKRIPNYDFIFWLDKNLISNIGFKPTLLKMSMTLVDSTGRQHRNIDHKWNIE